MLLRKRPATGLGLGRFPTAYAEAAIVSGGRVFKTPNSALLEIWADAGMLGLAAVFWMALRIGHVFAFLVQRHGSFPSWRSAGLGATLAALAVHGVFEANNVILWASSTGYGYLACPLPYAVLGLLSGVSRYERWLTADRSSNHSSPYE